MRVLLDTVTLIWAMESPRRLSRRAAMVFGSSDHIREVSALSLSEIAIKQDKLKISAQETAQALEDLDVRILPYTRKHAFELFNLPLHHRDPFDRHLIAQALAERIPVVTADRTFRLYAGIKVIW